MRTRVIQSYRARDVPDWIGRCLGSVRAWALGRGYDYLLTDDSAFDLCGSDYLAQVGPNMRSITNLCRLELIRQAHGEGCDLAVWLDADVFVFDPGRFDVATVERYAFARETWIELAGGDRWRAAGGVNNSVCAFRRGEPDLDFLIGAVRHVAANRPIHSNYQVGGDLIKGLRASLGFETLGAAGMLSNYTVLALAADCASLLGAQARLHGASIHAANLCASENYQPSVSEAQALRAMDRLEETRGGVINSWLEPASTARLAPGASVEFEGPLLAELQPGEAAGPGPPPARSGEASPRRVVFGRRTDWIPFIERNLDAARFTARFADLDVADLEAVDAAIPLALGDYAALDRRKDLNGVKYLRPDPGVVELADDKLAFARLLIDQGFGAAVPQLRRPGPPYPYIWKRRHGEWGVHCKVVRTPEDEASLDLADPDWFAQQLVAGAVEYTVHLLRVGGQIRYAGAIRFEMGAPDLVRGAQDGPVSEALLKEPEHVDLFAAILDRLGYQGTCCFNYKLADGRPLIFELNPRFGGSLARDVTRYLDAYLAALAPAWERPRHA